MVRGLKYLTYTEREIEQKEAKTERRHDDSYWRGI